MTDQAEPESTGLSPEAQAAFREMAELWLQAQPALTLFLAATVRDAHAIDDIHQEVAKVVIEKYDTYDRTRPFTPWVVGIARVLVAKFLRVNYRQPMVLDQRIIEGLADEIPRIEPELEKRKQALRECIEALRGTAKRIIKLRYLHEMGMEAVAEEVGSTRNAVRVALHRARATLADCVERRIIHDR